MSDIAIRVENLGKEYRIGGLRNRTNNIREAITNSVTAPFRRTANLLRGQAYGAAELDETIWALKEVSFEVKQGEVVGIIGRNGAGKSTLLKILSRITEPSEGYAEIYGRVGSLLEVGTGFHSELTGRENIYLNGAILGMSRAEIDRKFDEIVDFAGVEKFIDTPVKHYSSGMGLRLGFAVAAHLEPDILVVDEVLAVGDAEFQRKCLGKMQDVAGEGRTVLFVSHNMVAVESLCSDAILLESGRINLEGEPQNVIQRYLGDSDVVSDGIFDLSQRTDAGDSTLRVLSVTFLDKDGCSKTQFRFGESLSIVFDIDIYKYVNDLHVGIGINNWRGQRVFTVSNSLQNIRFGDLNSKVRLSCELPPLNLAPGKYRYKLAIKYGTYKDDIVIDNLSAFEVVPTDIFGSGRKLSKSQGDVVFVPSWQLLQR